jgi:hypothetical protein
VAAARLPPASSRFLADSSPKPFSQLSVPRDRAISFVLKSLRKTSGEAVQKSERMRLPTGTFGGGCAPGVIRVLTSHNRRHAIRTTAYAVLNTVWQKQLQDELGTACP